MTIKIGNRAQETTTTTGTGTINLAGATTQCQSIVSAIGNGSYAEYVLVSGNGTDWEKGIGFVTSGSPNTWTRSRIIQSTNSNSAISLSGTSTITLLQSAHAVASRGHNHMPGSIPALANWTQVGITGTTSITSGVYTITIKDTGANALNLRGLRVAAPSAPYRVAIGMKFSGWTGQWGAIGAGWSDGTKYETLSIYYANTNYETWSSNTSRASATQLSNMPSRPLETLMQWIGLHDDGTNYYLESSLDGVNWITQYSTIKSAGYLGATGYTNIFWGLIPDWTLPINVTLMCWDTNGLYRGMP